MIDFSHAGNGKADVAPRYDEVAEQGLIASCLMDETGATLRRIAPLLDESDFSIAAARTWSSLRRINARSEAPDPLLLLRDMETCGPVTPADASRVLEIPSWVVSPANAGHYADLVLARSRHRALLNAVDEVRVNLEDGDDADSALATLSRRVESIKATRAALPPDPWNTAGCLVMQADTTEWLWHGYLARGSVAILAGHPKAGKSTLLWGLLYAIERGRTFLGQSCAQSPVVMLSEEPVSTLVEKRDRFKVAQCAIRTKAEAFPRRPFAEVMDAAAVEAKRIGAGLVIVDTWAFWAALGADAEKDAGATMAAMEHVSRCAATGPAVLLVHHLKKADGDEGTGLRGSSALAGSVESILELRRYDQKRGARNSMRTLHVLSRHDQAPQEVVIDLQGSMYVCVGDAAQARDQRIAEQLREYVGRHPWAPHQNVIGDVPGSRSAKITVLEDMVLQGLLQRIGSSRKNDPYRYATPGVAPPTGGPEDVL